MKGFPHWLIDGMPLELSYSAHNLIGGGGGGGNRGGRGAEVREFDGNAGESGGRGRGGTRQSLEF